MSSRKRPPVSELARYTSAGPLGRAASLAVSGTSPALVSLAEVSRAAASDPPPPGPAASFGPAPLAATGPSATPAGSPRVAPPHVKEQRANRTQGVQKAGFMEQIPRPRGAVCDSLRVTNVARGG